MSISTVEIGAVHSLISQREIELVIAPAPMPFSFCLHAQYEEYGDFFSVLASGVRYLEFCSGMVVGAVLFERNVRDVIRKTQRWHTLSEDFVESAFVAFALPDDPPAPLSSLTAGILVADTIEIRPGRDWPH